MGLAALAAAMLLAPAGGGAGDAAGTRRHLIYLHGRIVQDQQSARPRHPEWGYYELEQILETFRKRGFVVTGEIRPKAASLGESADRVPAQVRALLASGVPAERVTIVGGSMGASIAFLASVRLQDARLRFAVLGACLSANVRALVKDEGKAPSGRILAVRETSDELTGGCERWQEDGDAGAALVGREIVLNTGLGHGFLYRPLPEWVEPVVRWAESR
jgi:pimeloyl-ACP methyl ester carboxylesterase